jgi:hypothetical protein
MEGLMRLPSRKIRLALAGAAVVVAAAAAVSGFALRTTPVETATAAQGVVPVRVEGFDTVYYLDDGRLSRTPPESGH